MCEGLDSKKEWGCLQHPEFDNVYVSADGDVVQNGKLLNHCLSSSKNKDGTYRTYLRVGLKDHNGRRRHINVARLVAAVHRPLLRQFNWIKMVDEDHMNVRANNLYGAVKSDDTYHNYMVYQIHRNYYTQIHQVPSTQEFLDRFRSNILLEKDDRVDEIKAIKEDIRNTQETLTKIRAQQVEQRQAFRLFIKKLFNAVFKR